MVSIVLTSVCVVLFVAYNVVAVCLFGYPWSMSQTYYLYEAKKRGLGLLFTCFMWVLSFTMFPILLDISQAVGGWMSYFQFLAFLTCASMIFIGAAVRYKERYEGTLHTVSAIVCAVCALSWDFVVCWQTWAVTLVGMLIPAIIATVMCAWKTSRVFWLEMIAFGGTFATALTQSVLIYLNE